MVFASFQALRDVRALPKGKTMTYIKRETTCNEQVLNALSVAAMTARDLSDVTDFTLSSVCRSLANLSKMGLVRRVGRMRFERRRMANLWQRDLTGCGRG